MILRTAVCRLWFQSDPDRRCVRCSQNKTERAKGKLCLGDLGQSLALLESALLLEAQDLEALEVGQSGPLGLHVALLGPVGVLELLVDLFLRPQLLDGGRPGGTGQAGDDEVGQDNIGERNSLAGDGKVGV